MVENTTSDIEKQRQTILLSATQTLERNRSLHAEKEASLLFSSHLLSYSLSEIISSQLQDSNNNSNNKDESNDAMTQLLPSNLPGGVQDAHAALVECCLPSSSDNNATSTNIVTTSKNDPNRVVAESVSNGQLAQICRQTALSTALKRAAQVSTLLDNQHSKNLNQKQTNGTQVQKSTNDEYETYQALMELMTVSEDDVRNVDDSENNDDKDPLKHWFSSFYNRLRDIREYHAKHDTAQNAALGSSISASIPLFPVMPTDDMNSNPEPINTKNVNAIAPILNPVSTNTQVRTLVERHKKRTRKGNPEADGYDLSSIISMGCQNMVEGGVFSGEEVLGKYLDLNQVFGYVVQKGISEIFQAGMEHLNQAKSTSTFSNTNSKDDPASISYLDFLSILLSGMATSLPEQLKLNHRKKYMKFLQMLYDYLLSFLSKTSPLLNITLDVIQPAMTQFETDWCKHGGVAGWEKRPNECSMASAQSSSSSPSTSTAVGLDISKYSSPTELEQKVDKDVLKAELSRLGMKCGGTPLDRAKRLFLTKDTPFDKLPKKLFVKNKKPPSPNNTPTASNGKDNISKMDPTSGQTSSEIKESNIAYNPVNTGYERRVDIARLETVVTSLLHQLRPTLDATHRRADRRLTQTVNERDREVQEELYGTLMSSSNKRSKTDKHNGDSKEGDSDGSDKDDDDSDDDDDDDDDAPIYNPKGVPLGWDGKPIPYWLFKLHGLNHFFPCEICGNESYRGRRNFEKHFTESKHAYGMRCLGIPNTKHFHGVTKIEDALKLWEKLKGGVEGFDGGRDEEYEDSHGNVLKRGEYEDLARQGLL